MMAVALKSWKALGTSVHVVTTDEAALGRAEVAVSDVLLDVDSTYSRFRPDSELTHLNATAGRPVSVSPLLATALAASLRAARLSNGAVDPTVGAAVRLAGYDDAFSNIVAVGGPLMPRAWRGAGRGTAAGGAGRGGAPSCITSSSPRPAFPPWGGGVPSGWGRLLPSTGTSRRPPPSCRGRPPSTG